MGHLSFVFGGDEGRGEDRAGVSGEDRKIARALVRVHRPDMTSPEATMRFHGFICYGRCGSQSEVKTFTTSSTTAG